MWSLSMVMGITIPKQVRKLPQSPPMCLPSQGDMLAIEYLKDFGNRLDINEHEISQACNLASGFSDVVVILERPYAKSYDTPFEKFVQDCNSLQALDDIIRFATKGARSIHTVTILDAFSYQPNKNKKDGDRECHQLLAEILRIKKPKVVIRCHKDSYQDEWMKRFELQVDGYRLIREDVDFGDGHKAVLIQSFHPSCAVNNAMYRPEYRALLIHHFIAAFTELHRKYELPHYVEGIRKSCLEKGRRRPQAIRELRVQSWKAALYVSQELGSTYPGQPKQDKIEFDDDEPRDRFRRRERVFSGMYHWLRQLAAGSCTCGTLSIAKVMTYWKLYFKDDPIYEQVIALLDMQGNEQLEWFPYSASNNSSVGLSLEQQYSRLDAIQSPRTLYTSFGLGDQAPPLASTALKPSSETELPEDVTPTQLVNLISEHSKSMKGCLRRSSVAELSRSIGVADIIRRWDVYIEVVKPGERLLEEGEVVIRNDLAEFLNRFRMSGVVLAI
ncbi:hypothetical protein V8F33_005127 [Rhypophila sp. PSN 637]